MIMKCRRAFGDVRFLLNDDEGLRPAEPDEVN